MDCDPDCRIRPHLDDERPGVTASVTVRLSKSAYITEIVPELYLILITMRESFIFTAAA